ncbi:MAG: hypothetical protein QOG13_2817 [Sphingomonadales bacterium]|jgi:hypothetical protein|nr:hypothetical protein [Sphingomonadales bacterium]
MVIILTALLASSKLLPTIDREALDLQARAEALQPRTHMAQPVRRPAPRAQVQPVRRPVVRRAAAGNALDLAQITTICRAAGEQADPGAFIGRLSNAYALSAEDGVSLRASCAAYLAGRADARRSSEGGTY